MDNVLEIQICFLICIWFLASSIDIQQKMPFFSKMAFTDIKSTLNVRGKSISKGTSMWSHWGFLTLQSWISFPLIKLILKKSPPSMDLPDLGIKHKCSCSSSWPKSLPAKRNEEALEDRGQERVGRPARAGLAGLRHGASVPVNPPLISDRASPPPPLSEVPMGRNAPGGLLEQSLQPLPPEFLIP